MFEEKDQFSNREFESLVNHSRFGSREYQRLDLRRLELALSGRMLGRGLDNEE